MVTGRLAGWLACMDRNSCVATIDLCRWCTVHFGYDVRVRNRDVMMMKRFELSENSMRVCVLASTIPQSTCTVTIPARARQLQMRVNVIALMVSRYCSFINRLVEPAQCFYTWHEKQIQPVTNHRTLRAIKLNGAQEVLDYCMQLKMTQQS